MKNIQSQTNLRSWIETEQQLNHVCGVVKIPTLVSCIPIVFVLSLACILFVACFGLHFWLDTCCWYTLDYRMENLEEKTGFFNTFPIYFSTFLARHPIFWLWLAKRRSKKLLVADFSFFAFFRIFGPFFPKISKKTRFFTQKGPKNPKKREKWKIRDQQFFWPPLG